MKFLKKIFKIIFSYLGCLICLIIATIILFIIIALNSPLNSDYCLEDGDCKEGRVLIFENEEVVINKDNCLKHNGKWRKARTYNYCKLNTGTFSTKEIIYD